MKNSKLSYLVIFLFVLHPLRVKSQLPEVSNWEIKAGHRITKGVLKITGSAAELTEFRRGGRETRLYKGAISGDVLTLESPMKNIYATEDSRTCHEYLMNHIDQFPSYKYNLKLRLDSSDRLVGTLEQPIDFDCNSDHVVSNVQSERSEIEFKRIRDKLHIYNQKGDSVSLLTNFSKPFPTVKIDESTVFVESVGDNLVSVSFSAGITDLLANSVEEKADIQNVYLEFLDPLNENLQLSEKLPVNKISVTPSKWSPYAHESRVIIQEKRIPLYDHKIHVNIKAVNILGNATIASLIINAKKNQTNNESANNQNPISYSYLSHKVSNGDASGYENPVQVSVVKSDLIKSSGDVIGSETITYNNRSINLVPDPEPDNKNQLLYLERPLIALDSVPPSLHGESNIIDVMADQNFELDYRDEKKLLAWTFTAHSPPNVYTYAIGLTYKHNIYSRVYRHGSGYESTVKKNFRIASIEGIYDEETKEKLISKENIRSGLKNIKFLQSDGWQFEFKIPYNRNLINKTALVKCRLVNTNDSNDSYVDYLGAFKIGTLKTLIVGVDGLSFEAANNMMNSKRERGFKIAFGKDDGIQEKCLSAIPTITWCNWTGIFSGQAPGKHGITGNSFINFNASDQTGLMPKLYAVDAVLGLDDDAHSQAKSLYNTLAPVYPHNRNEKLRVYSAYQWYAKSNDRVEMESSSYFSPKGLTLLPHERSVARRIDESTTAKFLGSIASSLLSDDEESIDIVTLYYPGPDNIAHALGKGNYDEDDDEINEQLKPGYKEPLLGPVLGWLHGKSIKYYPESKLANIRYTIEKGKINVDRPLKSIEEHMVQVTDFYFTKNVDFLRKNGLLYSTLFALASDHGLHAYHNDPKEFNIYPNDVLGPLRRHLISFLLKNRDQVEDDYYQQYLTEVGLDKFRSIPVFVNSTTHYAANGGMAHLYIRTGSNRMDNLMLHEAAKFLYLSATGAVNQEGIRASKISPKMNKLINGSVDNGALGKIPAIFLKACNSSDSECSNRLQMKYRWLKSVSSLDGTLSLRSVHQFLESSGKRNRWLDFEDRLIELNDQSSKSRSGDIVVFTDGKMGYLTINKGDELNGWHGGATTSESLIPMFINIPGTVVDETFIQKGFAEAKNELLENTSNSQYLRNWHLAHVLYRIFYEIDKN